MKKLEFDAFKAYESSNLKMVLGGTPYWRAGSSYIYSGQSSANDEELVSAQGEMDCEYTNGCIDGAYDCDEAKVLF